jgi:phenylacetic acid degradation operon negative regulatory protein
MARAARAARAARDDAAELSPVVAAAPHELQPQELVMTMTGSYTRADPRPVWSGGVVELLGEFGFTPAAARISLARIVRRHLLDRLRVGRLVFYTLTDRTVDLVQEGDRRIFELAVEPPLDGPWTFVWYSIPDDLRVERHRLSRRLRFLGFGALEDSTWVCPRDESDDVRHILDELDVAHRATLFVGAPAPGQDLQKLISSAWDLPALAARYERFVEAFAPYAERVGELSDREAFVVRTLAMDSYRRFPSSDPGLPAELVGIDWRRDEAERVFLRLWNELLDPAQRHFERVARPPQIMDVAMPLAEEAQAR